MKLLAHLIYLLNEQGVGNTFYLSPIIKKITCFSKVYHSIIFKTSDSLLNARVLS